MLDICAIVWDVLEPKKLSEIAKSAITKADECNELMISDISIWEIAMLIQRNRIEVSSTAADFINLFLQSRNVSVIPISPEIAALSTGFGAEINNDPADRIIATTSIIHNAQLITADSNLRQAAVVDTVW